MDVEGSEMNSYQLARRKLRNRIRWAIWEMLHHGDLPDSYFRMFDYYNIMRAELKCLGGHVYSTGTRRGRMWTLDKRCDE